MPLGGVRLLSCLLPPGGPLAYPGQTLALLIECPTIRDNAGDPYIAWYELLHGMEPLMRTLSISAQAMGVRSFSILLSLLEDISEELDLDNINIHIANGLLRVGCFAYTSFNRRVLLWHVHVLLQNVRAVKITIRTETITAADVRAELLSSDESSHSV
jgi:hypothetical protein